MKPIKKNKIVLNSEEELSALLQELYDETCMNITEIQTEITKLTQSTDLSLETMDGKAKYAKAINDFSTNKNKALATKMDIAKMMVEVMKHNGNVKQSVAAVEEVPENWGSALRDQLKGKTASQAAKENDNEVRKYHI